MRDRGRSRRFLLYTIALFWVALPFPSFAQPMIPATPAGHVLEAYLDAFNSADRAKIQHFIEQYDPKDTAQELLEFRGQTGGFDLLGIEQSTDRTIDFRVKGRGDQTTAVGSIVLSTLNPPKSKPIGVAAVPPGATVDVTPLDAAARKQVIDGLHARLNDYYIYPDVAQKMLAAVDQHAKDGKYDGMTDGAEFADALMTDLRDVSHDKHLFLRYNPYKTPPQEAAGAPEKPSAEEMARFRKEVLQQNCAFSKLEILPHNIGYVKLNAFPPPDFCAETAAAAMNFLAHTDALIYDLRENGGGDPSMVDFMLSYLFDEQTHINDLVNRHAKETHQYWTLPYVPGPRFPKQPVYVLTSTDTFSGAEEFTYDLKTQKRATIVGETTGGGAHPVEGMPLGDHFLVGVPLARPVNPISKTDWEGTGVEPDVKVPAADALATAQKLDAK